MSSLVKNQIAKQLARFTKNLSPNKISVKFLKGEGELHNLELDEKILSDLLELPPWLRITKAVCNKISAKIHWTRLKTDPICLFLDCVQIDLEQVVVNNQVPPSKSNTPPTNQPAKEKPTNRYGFVEKVVDGMYVQINSVLVAFKAPDFAASFQMSRLIIQSTTPEWKADDLRNTRLKDEIKGEVLTFKEINWSTLRVDAYAQVDENGTPNSSPIRLITSQSSLQIAIKKRIEDCSVLSACLKLLLDDILWVLTQSQLQALMNFLNQLSQSINSGPKKEPTAGNNPGGQASQQQTHTHTQYSSSNLQNGPDKQSNATPFAKYDLFETSYHLRTGQIDLHLSDDSNLEDQQGNKAKGVDQLAGGAMQIRINKLATDYYPYHLAGTSRTRWECHNEASLSRAYWVNQLLNTFRNNIRSRKISDTAPPRPSKLPTRSTANGSANADGHLLTPVSPMHNSTQTPPSPKPSRPPPPASPKPTRPPPPTSPQHQPQPKITIPSTGRRPVFMYEECYLIRCEEFAVMPVTTYNAPDEGTAFLSSDKKALYLPTDMPAFQIDYTQYYYPSGITSPVPPPNLFVQLNPVQLTLDTTTCIWFNRFMTTILRGGEPMEYMKQDQPTEPQHIDIRFEALMPKIIIPCPSDPCALYRELRPQALQIQMSQMFFTNSRIGSVTSQTELLMLLQKFSASKLYSDYGSFPNDIEDIRPLSNLSWLKDAGVIDDPVRISRLLNGIQQAEPYHTDTKSSQVWCMSADQVWADFLGITSNKDRPMPFIDAIPIRLWICTPLPDATPRSVTSQQAQPITSQQGKTERIYSSGRTNWYTSVDESSGAQIIPRRASERFEHEKAPEPHSAASSPGVIRAHHTLSPSSIHTSKSSPNLKKGSDSVEIGSLGTDSSSGIEVNGHCSSLPPSPRSQQSGFELADVNSTKADNLSLDSQPCSSSSQEDFILIENSTERVFNPKEGFAPVREFSTNGVSNSEGIPTYRGNQASDGDSPTTPTQRTLINGVLGEGVSQKGPSSEYLADQVSGTIVAPEENLNDVHGMEPSKRADMSVMAYIPTNVVVQLEHFHLIFLFRLQEMLEKLKEEVLRERQKHMRESEVLESAPGGSMTFSLQAKSAALNIILPPGPEPTLIGGNPTRGDSSLSSYLDPGFVSDGGSGSPEVVNDTENRTSPDALCDDTGLGIKLSSDPVNESLPVEAISGEPTSGRVSSGSGVEADGCSRGRRDSEASCASSQLGTSVDSSAKSSARGLRSGRIVSIFNAEGSDIHMGIQMEGEDIALKLTAAGLKVDEKGNCNIDKYLNQKSFKSPSRDNKTTPVALSPNTPPVLSVRAEFGPGAERNAETAGERGFAHVQVGSVSASLLMSSMESLSDCFDDEIILPKMPIYVELKNSCVSLRDDKPPRLLSAPPALPINVNIETLTVFRNHEGVVSIKALSTGSEDVREATGTCSTLAGYTRDSPKPMSRQLSRTASESSLAESLSSRSDNYDSERESVKAQLSVSRAALHAVQEERQALLKTIERLQMELTLSNRETDRLQSKILAYETGRSSTPSQRRKSHR